MDKPVTIMVVDDDRDLTEQMRLVLAVRGYEVAVADNVEDAWKVLDVVPVHLIILDVMMENDGDGFNFAQQLAAKQDFKHIPILMVTSVNQKMPFTFDKETDGAFLPVEKFMEKPVDPEALVAAVKEILEKNQD